MTIDPNILGSHSSPRPMAPKRYILYVLGIRNLEGVNPCPAYPFLIAFVWFKCSACAEANKDNYNLGNCCGALASIWHHHHRGVVRHMAMPSHASGTAHYSILSRDVLLIVHRNHILVVEAGVVLKVPRDLHGNTLTCCHCPRQSANRKQCCSWAFVNGLAVVATHRLGIALLAQRQLLGVAGLRLLCGWAPYRRQHTRMRKDVRWQMDGKFQFFALLNITK